MKSFNILFALLLMACFALSFMAPNNLDIEAVESSSTSIDLNETLVLREDADTISFAELNKFVTKELIKPVSDCLEKKDPHVFMTKCYSRVFFELENGHRNGRINRKIYKDSYVKGTLIFMNCSEPNIMASIEVNYDKKEILVKESFRQPQVKHSAYLEDICNFIDKNGIPGTF